MTNRAELLRLRDEVIGLRAQIVELQSQPTDHDGCRRLLVEAEGSIKRLELEIAAMRESRTWKVGRGVLLPVRSLRCIFGGLGSAKSRRTV